MLGVRGSGLRPPRSESWLCPLLAPFLWVMDFTCPRLSIPICKVETIQPITCTNERICPKGSETSPADCKHSVTRASAPHHSSLHLSQEDQLADVGPPGMISRHLLSADSSLASRRRAHVVGKAEALRGRLAAKDKNPGSIRCALFLSELTS